MGAIHHTLPLPSKPTEASFRSAKVEPEKIRVVIPVHNDWEGLKITLDSLQELNPCPGNITVANDNADETIPEWLASYPVEIVNYEGNRGPAYARNKGCGHPDMKFDWFYFTDCGCRHTKNLLRHFIDAREKRDDSVIAICGSVTGKGSGVINRYMTEMNTLNPPFENELGPYGEEIPQGIITSNALVYAPAFHQLEGFSVDFCEAGGEDLDLGIRLRELGTLVYVPDAIVSHEFEENIQDFKKRFERYGKGNRLLEKIHKLPSLRARHFPIANVEFRELVKLQIESLHSGYEQAKKEVSTLDRPDNTHNQIAKDIESTKWHLPEGVKRRLGKGKINNVQYSPDGNQRAVASSIGVWIYDAHTGKELIFLPGHTGRVLSIAYSPDGLTLASGSEDKTLRFWDTQTGVHKFTLTKHKESVTALAFSPDGSGLVSGSADGTVHVWDAHTGDHKSTLPTPKENIEAHITALAFSPDGSRFVSGETHKHKEDKYYRDEQRTHSTLGFWETETRFGQNQCLETLNHPIDVASLTFSPDGSKFARASTDGNIYLHTGEREETLAGHESGAQALAFSPDSRTLAGGNKDGSIYVWDTDTCRRLATLKEHTSLVSSVGFSHNGATLISESEDGTLCVWKTNTGESKTIFTEHLARVRSIKFSPDSQTLMSKNGNRIGSNDALHIWNADTGMRKATLTAHSYYIDSAEFSPDSSTLAICSKTGMLELWEVETGLPKIIFTEQIENVEAITFSPDGGILASWGNDSIVLWNIETGKRKTTFTEGLEHVESVTFSPTGRTLISRSRTETRSYHNSSVTIHLWDVETGTCKVDFTETGEPKERTTLLSPDNRMFIRVSRKDSKDERGYRKANGIIHLLDVEMDHPETTLAQEGMGIIKSVHLSSDNRMLISVSKDNTDRYSSREYDTIRLWDMDTGTCKANLTTENLYNIKSVHLSSDNRTLISVSENTSNGYYRDSNDLIHLWDVDTGACKSTFTEGLGDIKSVLLSSDNRMLISVSEDNGDRHSSSKDDTIHFWDVETGKCKRTFTEVLGEVMSIDFVPGDRTLISVSRANKIEEAPCVIVHLWDVETGERKPDPIGNINCAVVSPDGSTLASGNDEGTILLWSISEYTRRGS